MLTYSNRAGRIRVGLELAESDLQDHFATPNPQVCWFQKEKSLLRKPDSPTKGVQVLETAVGAVFALTRFSLVRISIRDLVGGGKTLVRNSGVGGGGENLILRSVQQFSRTNVCRVKNAMKLGICSCKASREKWREKFVVKNSRRFRASFPEERGAAKFHQKFHGIFHGNFHAQFQEKISRQQFCTPCRSDSSPEPWRP